jgi:hypothetical protein
MIWRGMFCPHRTKLFLPHKTLETLADQTLHSILVEVLLCIEEATKLVVGYQPWDTYCRCCFVLFGKMYFAEEVVVADVAVTRALAPRAHVPVDGGALLLIVALPELLCLV